MQASGHDTFDLTQSVILDERQEGSPRLPGREFTEIRRPISETKGEVSQSPEVSLPSDLMLSSSFIAKNSYFQLKSQLNAERERHIQQLKQLRDAHEQEKRALESHYQRLLDQQRAELQRKHASSGSESMLLHEISMEDSQKFRADMLEGKIAFLERENEQLKGKVAELEQMGVEALTNKDTKAGQAENGNNISFGWPVSEIRRRDTIKDETANELEQLRRDKQQLEELNKQVQQQLQQLKNRTFLAYQLKEETGLLQQQLRSAETEVSFQREQIRTLRESLEQEQQARRQLQHSHMLQVEQLTNVNQLLKQEMREYAAAAVEVPNSLNEKLNHDLEQQGQRVRELKAQLQTKEQQYYDETAALKQKLQERQLEVGHLQKELDELRTALTSKADEMQLLRRSYETQISELDIPSSMQALAKSRELAYKASSLQQETEQLRDSNTLLKQQLQQYTHQLQLNQQESRDSLSKQQENTRELQAKYDRLLRKSKQAVSQLTESRRLMQYEKFKAEEKYIQSKRHHERKVEQLDQSIQSMNQELKREREQYALYQKQQQDTLLRLNQSLVQVQDRSKETNQKLKEKTAQLEEVQQQCRSLTAEKEQLKQEVRLMTEGNSRFQATMQKMLPRAEPKKQHVPLLSLTSTSGSPSRTIIEGLYSGGNTPRYSLSDELIDQIEQLVTQKNQFEEEAKQVALELYKCRKESDQRIYSLTCELQSHQQRIRLLEEQLQHYKTDKPKSKDLEYFPTETYYTVRQTRTPRDHDHDFNQSFTERSQFFPSTPPTFRRNRTRQVPPPTRYIATTPKKTPTDISWQRAKQRTTSQLQSLTAASVSCLNLLRNH